MIPIPPAISSVLRRRRTASVNAPNGPSATTRVPTGIDRTRRVWSPAALTLIRSERPSGAAESENGCAVHQNPRGEEAPEEELPRPRVQPVEASGR